MTSDSLASSRKVLHLAEASCAAIVIFVTGLRDSEQPANSMVAISNPLNSSGEM